jgi:hypothetical protein
MPKRGSTTARGYGRRHRKIRDQVAKLVARGDAVCWRCGLPILPGMLWDLGHSDIDRLVYMGPEHQRCNRSSAASRGNRMRRKTMRIRVGRTDAHRW